LEPIQILHESGLFKEVTYQGTIVTAQFNARGGEEFSAKLYVSEKQREDEKWESLFKFYLA